MSRKNLLVSLTERKLTAVNPSAPAHELTPSPALERNRGRGAFGAITRSIDELAEKAQAARDIEARLLEGAAIIEVNPQAIDVSFIADRMEDDEEAFNALLEAIREQGQDSPILLRPHPSQAGRYMIVFGHRRHRVARALGRMVRAVVKELDDREHVIAQGQENSARADLSFIEKAAFAGNLGRSGYEREVIMQALSVDKTVVSKMLSVVKDIPDAVIASIGAARNSGRDRWYRLAQALREAEAREAAIEITGTDEFAAADSDERLALLVERLEPQKAQDRKAPPARQVPSWVAADKSVTATLRSRGKKVSIDLADKDAKSFGTWISNNLDGLYEAFRKAKQEN